MADVLFNRILTASVSSLNTGQQGWETAADSELGFKMSVGKNGDDVEQKFLAKDQKIKVLDSTITGALSCLDDSSGGESFARYSADANGNDLLIQKSRHATIGSHTIVQDDDKVGTIGFAASDGADFGTRVAEIRAEVDDASPASSSIGGALVFSASAGVSADDLAEAGRFTKEGIFEISHTIKIKERAAALGDTAGYGQLWIESTTPCKLRFTDDAGTDFEVAMIGAELGEMYMYEAAETVTINTQDVYHAIKGFTAGSLSGWTFQDGRVVDANITSEADNTILRIVTSGVHSLTTGDVVTHTNMNDAAHNKPSQVTVIDTTTYDCDDITYVAGAGTSAGVVDEPGYLQAGVAAAGNYSLNYSCSGEAVGADTFKMEAFHIAEEKDNTAAELDLGNNDLGPIPGTGFIPSVAAGDRIWMGCKNKTGTDNFLITNMNINLHRL